MASRTVTEYIIGIVGHQVYAIFFFIATIGNEYSPGIRQLITYWESSAINMEMCSKQRESQTVQESLPWSTATHDQG